ncbi:MAG: DUF4185 domain-containing protein [Planctomycetales bacterium]|nr:DUF4185 domain-containing protein [Planctomycetales bacterium]
MRAPAYSWSIRLLASYLFAVSALFCASESSANESDAKSSSIAIALSPHVESVRNLGDQFLDNSVNVTGADGATSLELSDAASLWVFGDTVEGPFETIRGLDLTHLRSNTAAIVPRQPAAQGIGEFHFLATADGKRPRQLIPYEADESPSLHRIWGVHGLQHGQNVFLFYHRISLLPDVDVFANFRLDGMGVARSNVDELQFARLMAPDGTREFWKGDQPTFGVFVDRRDDTVYLWGSLLTGMFLARVSPDRIDDLDAYEYLIEAPTKDDPHRPCRWGKKFHPTAVLFDGVPNEMSAAYNSFLKCYVAFHSWGRDHALVLRTAPEVWGPWSEPQLVYEPPRLGDDDLIYAAKEHPELARADGRIVYLTYINSTTYVPQLVEVSLRREVPTVHSAEDSTP